MWPYRKRTIDQLRTNLPREILVRRSRILVVDDELPDIVGELKKAGFSADYESDVTQSNLHLIEAHRYDALLLDFASVGSAFGKDHGLSLLKHVKRVNPAIVVLAYTSKALSSEHAEFYRMADGVLSKDAGIARSLQQIEEALRKAYSVENMWRGILAMCDVAVGSTQDCAWQDLLVRGVTSGRKLDQLKVSIAGVIGEDAHRLAIPILEQIVKMALGAHGG